MYNLDNDPVSRAEKHRKHQYYRSMLDEQIRMKQTSNKPRQVSYENGKSQESQGITRKQEFPSAYSDNHRYDRHRTQNQSKTTQQYIQTCEDIIKSLKQLKKKHQESQQNNERFRKPERKESSRNNTYDIPRRYQHKRGYFNNISHLYRDPQSQGKVQRSNNNTQKHKTIDQQNEKHIKQNQRTIKRIKLAPLKRNARLSSQNERTSNERDESPHPEGIKKRNVIMRSKQKGKGRDLKKNSQSRQQQLLRIKQQLLDCLVELNRYLDDQKGRNGQNKDEQGNQNQNNGEEANKNQQNRHIDQQIQVGQSSNQYLQAMEKSHRITEQKLKSILKLRRIHEKSKQLSEKIQLQKSQKMPKSQLQQSKIEVQCEQSTYRHNKLEMQTFEASPESRARSPTYAEIEQEQRDQNQFLEDQKTRQTEELISAVLSHLSKQEEQNEDLVYCLKQLSKYLTNQNKNIKRIRQEQRQPPRVKSSLEHPTQGLIKNNNQANTKINSRTATLDPEKQSDQSPTIKLQEAIVRRLKKARIRGSLLSEKIASHKKNNSKMSQMTTEQQLHSQRGP